MKNVLILSVVLLAGTVWAGTYGGGNGTAEEPYEIWTPEQMNTIGLHPSDWNKYFELMANIDMSAYTGTEYKIIGNETTRFTGTFDGNGHVIGNLTIERPTQDYTGLFGCLGPGGRIVNLGIENIDIAGSQYVGGLVGTNWGGTITSCYVVGTFSGSNRVGGLCGYNNYGTISNCYATGAVAGNSSLGGLCGYNWSGTISNCYATGTVAGNSQLGGLCGSNSYGTISNCYATGEVTGNSSLGGLCGYNWSGTITACYWDTETSGMSISDGGWGLTTAQMKEPANFYGWTDGRWTINQGLDYPRLLWQNAVGVIINTDYPAATYLGAGTQASPYEIATAEDLLSLMYHAEDWNKHFIMTADIDLSGLSFKGSVIAYGSTFKGNFNGKGQVISNLSVSGVNFCGLFGRIGSGGVVTGLGLENADVIGTGNYIGGLCGQNSGTISNCYATGAMTGNSSLGGLCGYNSSGTINNCYATGVVTGAGTSSDYLGGLCGLNADAGMISNSYATCTVIGGSLVGGLCGLNARSMISNCYATGTVTGGPAVGGLCGYNSFGTISNCYATGAVTGISQLGGLCGSNFYGTISDCYATGAVTGAGTSSDYLGGLCGSNSSGTIISNCYATGAVAGNSRLGGLCGSNSGTISKCYATGAVAGNFWLGGLCGYQDHNSAMIENCFWDIQTSGLTAGYTLSSSTPGTITNVSGKTTAEMKAQSAFTDSGWDFISIWWMPHNDYPRLAWEPYSGGRGTIADPYVISSVSDFLVLSNTPNDWGKCFILNNDIELGDFTFTQSPIAPDTDNTLWNDFQGTAFTGVFDGNGHVIKRLTIDASNQDYVALFGFLANGGQIINLGLTHASIQGRQCVGGLTGENSYGDIVSSYTKGHIVGDEAVGGLAGRNYGMISSCYSQALVEGVSFVGGATGWNWRGIILSTYTSGTIYGDDFVGGFIGWNYQGTMNDCFWDMLTTGQNLGVGFGSITGVNGRATYLMQTLSTFIDAGWDFDDTWSLCEGTNYPRFQWQILPADFACPDGVNNEDLLYFSDHWLMTYCTIDNNYCGGADLNYSGVVDLADWAIFAESWLRE